VSATDRLRLVMRRQLTLGGLAERLAAVHGDRLMVEEPDGLRVTFAQAAERVEAMAAGMAARTTTGDRIVLPTANGYDQFLLCLAACRAGAVAVPVNPQMRPNEVEYVVRDSGAALVVRSASDVLAVGLDGPSGLVGVGAAVAEREVAAIFYTSGTTGKPKGVRLSHRALIGQATPAALWPSGLRRDEAVLALPVAHIMGFSVLTALACAGLPVFVLPKFKAAAVLDAIETRRATMFVGVPAMYRLLLEAGAEERDLRSVRVWASGADVMPPDLARRFQAMGAAVTLPLLHTSLGDAAFVEGYGMVETGGGVAARLSPPGPHLARHLPRPFGGVLGVPLPPNRMRVMNDAGEGVRLGQVGELWIKGPSVLEGYHGDPQATSSVRTQDGWLRTGDLVRRGPLGMVAFVGRDKDVIKSGGYSVYAAEVERAMEGHEDVVEAAALGLADARLGEVPGVAVRVRDGASVSEAELVTWGREHLSSYKAPRAVRIVSELPRTGTDKVAKQRLVPLFAD
jgi:acyl-CoA synthetase (AMP-forming)/AMP-acid ligase II